MGKGKPNKKHPRSQAKGKSKHEGTIPRDGEGTKQGNAITNGDQVDDGIDVKEVIEIATESHVEDIESKKYARRKIESNWSRYDEAEVDESFMVGEDYDETKDFEYIRQNSASALSHFKFKEEQEWENELHQANNAEKSVLGLNLVELAADLQQYGVEEKLGLVALIQEECKYCIKDLFECTLKPQQSSSCPYESIKTSERIVWSYDGIEKYKHLIGLIKENEEVHIYRKPEQNNYLGGVHMKVEHEGREQTGNNVIKIYNKDVHENSMDSYASIDSRGDCDILDELLINKISFTDSNERPNDCTQNENELIKNIENDNELINQSHNKNYLASNKESEELPIFQSDDYLSKENDGVAIKNIESEEELDLDMLLDCDILSSVSETKDGNSVDGQVDADLDQWLDDMLM